MLPLGVCFPVIPSVDSGPLSSAISTSCQSCLLAVVQFDSLFLGI